MSSARSVRPRLLALGLIALAWAVATPQATSAQNRPLVIKLGTLAPNGSAWHDILKEMGARWADASDGQVELRIYPGGVAGDEPATLRRMRIGQLHAGSLSLAGLSRITTAVYVLAIPMTMRTWDDLERVRGVMQPRLEDEFLEAGYVVLNWGDVGWVRFFLPEPDASIEAVKKLRFVGWSDDSTLDLWRAAGFRNVTLNLPDILPGFQTGLIDAVGTTPLMVLSNQWFPYVPYMIDMPWTPLVGATVVDRRIWDKVPEHLKPELMAIARETGAQLRSEIQRMERDAIAAMEERGLQVVDPGPELREEWTRLFEAGYDDLRKVVPEDWFDEVLRLTRQPS